MSRRSLLPLVFLSACLLAACGGSAGPATPTFTPQEARGQQAFYLHCAACHATDPDVLIVGPSLAGVASRAGDRVPGLDAAAYLQQSILQPRAFTAPGFKENLMPTDFGKKLTGEELDALVAFLLTLR